MKIVTACDEAYFPGVKALWNSIQQNAPDSNVELWCLAYGDVPLGVELASLGIHVIMNPEYPEDTALPIGGWWEDHQMPAMYARLLIPELFPDDERITWLDADMIVRKELIELEATPFEGHPIAAFGNGQAMRKYTPLIDDGVLGFCTAVMPINIQEWIGQRVTEKCFTVMNNHDPRDMQMFGVVETVMNIVLPGQFALLDEKWHFVPKRREATDYHHILHFSCLRPWDAEWMKRKPLHYQKMVKKLWEPYR